MHEETEMLVLTRKENETLVINGDIRLTILSVKGGQVRVGIDAPKEIPVHREELILKEQANKNTEQGSDS